jgi:hypothetical protein
MCSVFGCPDSPDDNAIEIKQGKEIVGRICSACFEGMAGVHILLKKQPEGYELEQVDLLEKIF